MTGKISHHCCLLSYHEEKEVAGSADVIAGRPTITNLIKERENSNYHCVLWKKRSLRESSWPIKLTSVSWKFVVNSLVYYYCVYYEILWNRCYNSVFLVFLSPGFLQCLRSLKYFNYENFGSKIWMPYSKRVNFFITKIKEVQIHDLKKDQIILVQERGHFGKFLGLSNALSFYRSQNVLCRSKFFEPAQKFDCI